MVGQLISLKLKMQWNSISKQIWILIITILGLLQGLAVIFGAHLGAIFASSQGYIHIVSALSVFIGAALILGWIIGPVMTSGVDNTLDPRSLAAYVPPSERLGMALVAATGAGIAGVLSLLATIPLIVSYIVGGAFSAAALGVVMIPVASLTCWTWSRTVSTFLGVIVDQKPRLKDTLTVVGVLLFLAIISPLGIWINLVADNFSVEWVLYASTVVAWTPLGAPFGSLASLAAGHYLAAGGQVLISFVFLAIGSRLWNRMLPFAMSGVSTTPSLAAWEAIDQGRHLVDEKRSHVPALHVRDEGSGSAPRFLPGVDFWQRMGFSLPSASVAARTVHDWIKDPRLSTSASILLIFPFIAVMMSRFTIDGSSVGGVAFFLLLFGPIILGATAGALSSYDSTAFWILIASGVRGRHERLGRMAGSAVIHLPLIVISSLVTGYFLHLDAAESLTAALFFSCIYVMTLALCSILAAFVVYPVQPPGTSPLSTKGTGSFMVTMLVQLGGQVGSLVLALPALVLIITSWIGVTPLWLSQVVSVGWAALVFALTPMIAGRIWDARSVDVLRQIRSWPGH